MTSCPNCNETRLGGNAERVWCMNGDCAYYWLTYEHREIVAYRKAPGFRRFVIRHYVRIWMKVYYALNSWLDKWKGSVKK
jgi:hypothetical protein